MKRIAWWLLVFMLWTVKAAETQDPNPQTSFSTTLLYAKPSLYLNYNDFATSFLDQISGLSFAGNIASSVVEVGQIPASLSSNTNAGQATFPNTTSPAGTLNEIQVQYATAPTAGSLTIIIANKSGTSFTITSSFTVAVTATTAVQTFIAPTDFTAVSITAGQAIGFYTPSGGIKGPAQGTGSFGNYYLVSAALPVGAQTYSGGSGNTPAIIGYVTTSTPGTITVRQPGFDSTQINNTSVEFPWDGYGQAPNNTLGAIEWNVPYTLMVHIDRLNWSRTGTLVLASKGDISLTTTGNWWKIYLQMAGNYSQLCFARSGFGSTGAVSGGSTLVQNGICTGATYDAMPNGFNYNIMITDSGTGNSGLSGTAALDLYINGLDKVYIPETPFTNTFGQGFGYAALALSGSGSGYANSTAYTSTGGGAGCTVTGTMTSVSGVPSSLSPGPTDNWGCTSAPTIVFTAPTGTGETITATTTGTSMNSTTFPLMVPGYVSAGAFYGVAGTASTQAPTYVDEFAIFPGVLNQTQIQGIFYQTKFYQSLLFTPPPNPVAFIFSDDTCGDLDDLYALQMAISAERYGYLHIEGVEANNDAGPGAAVFRQILDQAGLANIPVANPQTGGTGYGGWCTAANINTYNASTPQTAAAYPSSTTMFRTVLAAHPTAPVIIFTGGWLTGVSQFLQSSADSISPLTGQQLWDRDATNGGAMYLQGGPTCDPPTYCLTTSTVTGDNVLDDPVAGQYVMAHHGAMPMYMLGGTPSSSGPGVLYTRTSKDPIFLATTTLGTDVRTGWDSLPMSHLLSDLFWGGVYITYSGGTGYANSTPFTLSGGGANCTGSGIMTASGGVPNGIDYIWGASAQNYWALGNGCTSAPTVNLVGATGTGVTLTAYPTSVCVTDRVTQTGGTYYDGVNSTTCDNQYVQPFSQYAVPAASLTSFPIYTGFMNSWMDPPPNGAPKVR